MSWCVIFVCGAMALAQTPPVDVPPPLIIGRDLKEPGKVIGKNYLLRVWLTDVAGAGVQQVRYVRVADDGNLTLSGIAPVKAEGAAISTVEQLLTTAYKAISPTATVRISIEDRGPPPPPPPAPATVPAGAPATKPATQAAAKPTTAPAAAAPAPAAPAK